MTKCADEQRENVNALDGIESFQVDLRDSMLHSVGWRAIPPGRGAEVLILDIGDPGGLAEEPWEEFESRLLIDESQPACDEDIVDDRFDSLF